MRISGPASRSKGEPGGLARRARPRPRGRSPAGREVDSGQRHPEAREDPLDRPAVVLAEGGAQRLVPAHDLVQRPREGARVQRPPQAQGRAHVERRIARLHAVEEPEALLGEGERRPSGPRSGRPAAAARASAGLLGPPRQLGEHGSLEQRAHGQLHPEAGAHAGEDLDRHQRVPAEVEEVVPRPDPLDAEDLAPDRRDLPLGGGRRLDVPGGRLRALRREGGAGQGAAVQLAARGQRQGGQRDEGGGDHRRRQARRERLAQPGLGALPRRPRPRRPPGAGPPAASCRATTAASRTSGWAATAASTSPGSTR